MPDVLLTDLDGTLVDSNALHAEAWRRTFEHFGIQIGLDEAWRQIGKGGDQLIPMFVPEADRERLERPLKEFRKDIFHRDYISRMVAFSRSRDLLFRVRESGMKIAHGGREGKCGPHGMLAIHEWLQNHILQSRSI